MAIHRIGCPQSKTSAHTQAQRKMKHHIKTAIGVSEGYIKYGKQKMMQETNGVMMLLIELIGGIGQGGGGSPILWMAVLMILLAAYKATDVRSNMTDPVTGNTLASW